MMRGESSAPGGSILANLSVGSPIDFVSMWFDYPAMTTLVVVRSRSIAPVVDARVRRIVMPLRNTLALLGAMLMGSVLIIGNFMMLI